MMNRLGIVCVACVMCACASSIVKQQEMQPEPIESPTEYQLTLEGDWDCDGGYVTHEAPPNSLHANDPKADGGAIDWRKYDPMNGDL